MSTLPVTRARGGSFKDRAFGSIQQRPNEQSRFVEGQQHTIRSAPAERPRYQLWPAPENPSDPTALPHPGRKRSTTELTAQPQPGRNRSNSVQREPERWPLGREQDRKHPPPVNWSRNNVGQRPPVSVPNAPPPEPAGIHSAEKRSGSAAGNYAADKRSRSAPANNQRSQLPKTRQRTPSKERMTESSPRVDTEGGMSLTCERRNSLKRASSTILPAELVGLSFLSLQQEEQDLRRQKEVKKTEEEKEFRPPVPPKSSPIIHPVVGTKTPPLRLLTSQSPSSKAVPAGTVLSTPEVQSSSSDPGGHHSREDSGDSIMDRGRPTKRNKCPTKEEHTSPSEPSPDDQAGNAVLPTGMPVKEARAGLPWQEIRKLEQQSKTQAERFEVLYLKDVKALSQRVRLLDTQCEHLRSFSKSLRANRRALHARTLTYLKSPRVADASKSSHESMVQKVETLMELDETVDEWARKLERAEDQRLRARQKLLEHIAAVLVVPTSTDSGAVAGATTTTTTTPTAGPVMGGSAENVKLPAPAVMPTPPESPETPISRKPERPMSQQTGAESIRIFAASDVQALLMDIDREIEASVEAGGHWM